MANLLCCPCGAQIVGRESACARCRRRQRLSVDKFGGLREQALHRDGYACLLCGSFEQILGHHRKPGKNALERIATLCRRCHPRIHFIKRLAFGVSPLFVQLWIELHRRQPRQRELPFFAAQRAEQRKLFAA